MKIEINDDCVDLIMEAALVNAYKQLREDLKKPEQWHIDDLQAFQDVFEALKVVGPWWVLDWKKKIK